MLGGRRIERAGRFVRQHQPRTIRQRPGDSHALLLPDGQLGGFVIQAIAEADFFQQMPRPFAVGAAPREGHPQQYVFQRRKAAKQVMGLKDVSDVSAAEDVARRFGKRHEIDRLTVRAAAEYDFARIRADDARDRMQQRRLAGSTAADERDMFAIREGKMRYI